LSANHRLGRGREPLRRRRCRRAGGGGLRNSRARHRCAPIGPARFAPGAARTFVQCGDHLSRRLWRCGFLRSAMPPILPRGIFPASRRRAFDRRTRRVAEYASAVDGITLWASTQKAHDLHQNLCAFTASTKTACASRRPTSAAAFGPKLCVYPEERGPRRRSQASERSLKWVEDRREHFISAVQERDQYWTVEIAVDADARILGIRGRLFTIRALCAARREPAL